LVCNDQALVQRLHAVQAVNLCGLPLAALLNWCRSARRPPVVTHQMQVMKSTAVSSQSQPNALLMTTGTSRSPSPSVRTLTRPQSPATGSKGARSLRPLSSAYPGGLSQIISALYALVALTIAIGIVWYVAQPSSLNRLLRQLRLPTLPELSLVPPLRSPSVKG
jgi:hypothetical protein